MLGTVISSSVRLAVGKPALISLVKSDQKT